MLEVIGYREFNENDRLMYNVYEVCTKANVSLPDEVMKHFGIGLFGEPDTDGVPVPLTEDIVRDWSDHEKAYGWEIHLDELPDEVTCLRIKVID